MNIRSRQDAEKARALFTERAEGATSDTDGLLRLQSALFLPFPIPERLQELRGLIERVSAERNRLYTIIDRHHWQKEMSAARQLPTTAWLFFATLDVEHYYIILRSLFDHFAQLCSWRVMTQAQKVTSFHDLLTRCRKHRQRAEEQFGSKIVASVLGCDWFSEIRQSRDGIVHAGSLTLALPVEDTVSFSIRGASAQTPTLAELQFNEHLADFELFVAWSLGGISVAVSDVCAAILDDLPDLRSLHLRSERSTYRHLAEHIERLAKRFDDRLDTSSLLPVGA